MSRLGDASARAGRLYPRQSFRRAYVRGAAAAIAGASRKSCPYQTARGWGAAYQAAWKRGFDSVGEIPLEG